MFARRHLRSYGSRSLPYLDPPASLPPELMRAFRLGSFPKSLLDLAGFEPATFRMQSGRAAVALQALLYSSSIGCQMAVIRIWRYAQIRYKSVLFACLLRIAKHAVWCHVSFRRMDGVLPKFLDTFK